MVEFESLINQERPVRILTSLLQYGTLPHALLFTGTKGVGKQATAIALAQACNCRREGSVLNTENPSIKALNRPTAGSGQRTIASCGVCKSCRKIASGNHPDIIRIQPSGAFIKIAQIRELVHIFAMKPYEAATRVAIISDAQTMNTAASNTLLKILEEPPIRTMLVLIATRKSDLLPTIVSRCQQIAFNPIARKHMASLLREKHGLESDAAAIVASMAKGSYSRAEALAQGNWTIWRKWLLNEIESLSLQPIGRLLALAEKLSAKKETLPDSLEVISVWFRDLIISRYDAGKIINQDRIDKIKITSRKMSVALLLSKIDAVQKVQNRMTSNTNLRLAMENLLIKLARP